MRGSQRQAAQHQAEQTDDEPTQPAPARHRPRGWRGRQPRRRRAPSLLAGAPAPQPATQQVQPAQVTHLVRDVARLGRAEPGSLILADQSLQRGPALERDEREGEDQRTENSLHVAQRRLLQDQPTEVHERQGEHVGEDQRPSEKRGPSRNVGPKHELRDEPADRAGDEQGGLQVIGRVVDELELLDGRDQRRSHDRQEPLADVMRMSLCPTHPLPRQPRERAHAFRGSLRPRRVDDLVAACVELEGELPVLRDARAPTHVAKHVGPDHVSRACDHLQRADRVLEGPFDHVAA